MKNIDKLRLGLFVGGMAAMVTAVLLPGTSRVSLHPETGYPNFVVHGVFGARYYKVGDIVEATDTIVNQS